MAVHDQNTRFIRGAKSRVGASDGQIFSEIQFRKKKIDGDVLARVFGQKLLVEFQLPIVFKKPKILLENKALAIELAIEFNLDLK